MPFMAARLLFVSLIVSVDNVLTAIAAVRARRRYTVSLHAALGKPTEPQYTELPSVRVWSGILTTSLAPPSTPATPSAPSTSESLQGLVNLPTTASPIRRKRPFRLPRPQTRHREQLPPTQEAKPTSAPPPSPPSPEGPLPAVTGPLPAVTSGLPYVGRWHQPPQAGVVSEPYRPKIAWGAHRQPKSRRPMPGHRLSGAFPSIQETPPVAEPVAEPFWPFKNHDFLRTGCDSRHTAPSRFEMPSWTFQEPDRESKGEPGSRVKVFQSSPIIDGEKNVYIVSTTGWMYSLTPEGELRWELDMEADSPGNPALVDGIIFTATTDGTAYAVEAKTGKKKWTSSIGMNAPKDSYSVIGQGDDIIFPATSDAPREEAHIADCKEPACGGEDIVCVSAATGRVKWRYNMAARHGVITYNAMPAILDASVVVSDASGGVHRLFLDSGEQMWYTPGNEGTWTTGGMAIGPNNYIYVAHQYEREDGSNGKGILRALDLRFGYEKWQRKFDVSLNAAPAVGIINGKLSVVFGAGNNRPAPPFSLELKSSFILRGENDTDKCTVYVVDAKDGSDIWNYRIEEQYGTSAKVKTMDSYDCAPSIFGTPAISADGTVYISWSGGKLFALRDEDHDNRVLGLNIFEVSTYTHGMGSNGETAIAPGLLVAPSCDTIYAFTNTSIATELT